jgi:hypothetical protein
MAGVRILLQLALVVTRHIQHSVIDHGHSSVAAVQKEETRRLISLTRRSQPVLASTVITRCHALTYPARVELFNKPYKLILEVVSCQYHTR